MNRNERKGIEANKVKEECAKKMAGNKIINIKDE